MTMEYEYPIIRLDEEGRLDEFIHSNAGIHFEVMNDGQYWMCVDGPDGRSWHINCGAKNTRAAWYAFVEEDK